MSARLVPTLLLAACAAAALPACTATSPAKPDAEPLAPTAIDTDARLFDYGLGVEVGRSMRNQGMEPDVELVVRGLRDALAGRQLEVGENELRRVMMQYRTELRRQRLLDKRFSAADNRSLGAEFRAEYGRKEGVVARPSGLQYRVLKAGDGPIPKVADRVRVAYAGRLIDGTEFDSSDRSSGGPSVMSLGTVITGWRLALLEMPVGSKWEVVLPPNLAYGARGTPTVGPEATLVFELELLEILGRK